MNITTLTSQQNQTSGLSMSTNVSLAEINDIVAITLLPAMLYVGILMVVGFFGNAFVVYIFIFKFRRGTQNFLITCLAIFDLLSCVIAMPTEIADMRYSIMFDSPFACKLLTSITHFCAMASVLTLFGIAVDRYIKICRPLSTQVELKHVQIYITVVVIVALAFSWPSLIIYGIRSVDTGLPYLKGRDCSTSDSMKNTSIPLMYNGLLAGLLIVSIIILSVLYVFIWRAVKIHRRHMQARTSVASSTTNITTIELSSSSSEMNGTSSTLNMNTNGTQTLPKRTKSHLHKSSKQRNKTTVIAFLVTVVFVLSFVPHLALMCARAIAKDFDHDLRGAALVTFNIFIRSYFINSAANPVIYGVLNYKFREHCWWIIRMAACCGRVKMAPVTNTPSFSTMS